MHYQIFVALFWIGILAIIAIVFLKRRGKKQSNTLQIQQSNSVVSLANTDKSTKTVSVSQTPSTQKAKLDVNYIVQVIHCIDILISHALNHDKPRHGDTCIFVSFVAQHFKADTSFFDKDKMVYNDLTLINNTEKVKEKWPELTDELIPIMQEIYQNYSKYENGNFVIQIDRPDLSYESIYGPGWSGLSLEEADHFSDIFVGNFVKQLDLQLSSYHEKVERVYDLIEIWVK